jgi:glycerol-3-phosphate acyltransferase PlsY
LVAVVAVGSYLVGSIPFSYLIPRLFFGVDIRGHGSGNVGATNVVRVLGKGPGSACFVLDVTKGVLPVVAAAQFAPTPAWLPLVAAACAILGHARSAFLGFAGGKAVATGVGTILALNPLVGLAALGLWAIVFLIARVVSVASMTAALALPGFMIALPRLDGGRNPEPYVYFSMIAGAYVILRHRENVRRIMDGTEPVFGRAGPSAPAEDRQDPPA